MSLDLFQYIYYLIAVVCLMSFGYLIFSMIAIEHLNRRPAENAKTFQPAVSVFKPVCGLDPDMAENLRSFCLQDYPEYQIIFGVQNQDDPALPIINKLIDEFTDKDIQLVINPHIHGSNHKVSNLINMYEAAKHDYILIADSDMQVPRDYLQHVINPFANKEIGAVTCLYSGSARGGIASSLNAMFINSWFLPSVLISETIEKIKYCLGATMVVRRDVLEKIGGLAALKDHLADDYMLGKLVSDAGYQIHLSHFVVSNIVEEASYHSLVLHELRWGRTLRTVEPFRYAMTFLTDTFVISMITALSAWLVSGAIIWPVVIVTLSLCARIWIHLRVKSLLSLSNNGSVWLVPLRDSLSFILRIISFTGRSVHWRNHDFSVDHEGLIHEVSNQATPVEKKKIASLATNQDF